MHCDIITLVAPVAGFYALILHNEEHISNTRNNNNEKLCTTYIYSWMITDIGLCVFYAKIRKYDNNIAEN